MKALTRTLAGIGITTACICFAGCSAEDPVPRYDVAGSVTYDGKPVPAGKVYFTPDAGKQNSGPQGVGEIQDGRYDTRKGRGGPGGAVLVRIDGYDGNRKPEQPLGDPVFTYQTKADLPRASSTRDFAITAAEAKKVVVPAGPPP